MQLGTRAVQGVRRPGKSLRVANLSEHRRNATAGARRVKGLQHLDVVEGCRKECVQEFPEGLEGRGKVQERQAFKFVEGQRRGVVP